ncbi:hypothetical protein ACXVRB_09760 [Limosilactobacillus ingluviei]
MTVWSKYRVEKEAIKLFNIIQEEVGFNGYIGQNEQRQKFMVIQAPEGAIQAVPLRIMGMKYDMDNKPKKEGLQVMEMQIRQDLSWGDTTYSTPLTEMSKVDEDYLREVQLQILRHNYYSVDIEF